MRRHIPSVGQLTLAKTRSTSVARNEALNTPGVLAKSLLNALPSRRNDSDPSRPPLRFTAIFLVCVCVCMCAGRKRAAAKDQKEGSKFDNGEKVPENRLKCNTDSSTSLSSLKWQNTRQAEGVVRQKEPPCVFMCSAEQGRPRSTETD